MNKNELVDILLIEDSLGDAEMATRSLRKNSKVQNLVHLEDGAEAIDFIFARGEYTDRDPQKTPKLIILDLNMPKINGMDVLEKIRADQRTKRIPVVVFTSSKEDSDVKKCYDLGVNSYIVKPVEFNEFTETVFSLGQYWLGLNLPSD